MALVCVPWVYMFANCGAIPVHSGNKTCYLLDRAKDCCCSKVIFADGGAGLAEVRAEIAFGPSSPILSWEGVCRFTKVGNSHVSVDCCMVGPFIRNMFVSMHVASFAFSALE